MLAPEASFLGAHRFMATTNPAFERALRPIVLIILGIESYSKYPQSRAEAVASEAQVRGAPAEHPAPLLKLPMPRLWDSGCYAVWTVNR